MYRAFAKVLGVAAAVLPAVSLALGLGPVKVESYLNEPLRARIPLSSFDPDAKGQIKVGLADEAAFERAGLDRPWWLNDLRFRVESLPDGSGVVILTTRQPVREPIATFVVEAIWPQGRLNREYALLIDPRPGVGASAPLEPQPVASAPQAPASAPVRPSAAAPTASKGGAQGTYGPTRRNDTAWAIASQVRPGSSVSVEQTMMALLRANPDAFIDGNVNRLRRGVTLNVPSAAEVAAMTRDEAQAAFREQTQAWREGRSPEKLPAAAPPPEEGIAAREPPGREEGAAQAGEPRLEIVPPDEGLDARLESLVKLSTGQRVEVLRERIEAYQALNQDLERRNDELEGRLHAIEEKMATMRQLLTAQNERLSRYQEQWQRRTVASAEPAGAAGPPVEAPETPPDPGADLLPADTRPPARADSSDAWSRGTVVLGLALAIVVALLVLLWVQRRRRGSAVLPEVEALPPDSAPDRLDAILVEIDVALAYRKLSQAENLLDGAEPRFGDEPALKAKRLELYAFRKDRKAFADYLEQVHESVRGGPPELWQHVQRLGRELIPDHPLIEDADHGSRGAA
ncbi:MAG: FimV/HubP family polar landmark protein [Chromatiales bacterium]|jgi:pilus assembly protein FimV